MPADKELEAIASQIGSLEGNFVKSTMGNYLSSENQARFKQLTVETISLLNSVLGKGNEFSRNIVVTVNNGSGGYFGGPSYACVQETRGLITAAVNHLKRMPSLGSGISKANQSSYIDPGRLTELRSITSAKFDLSRLIRLCEELNVAHANDCLMSIAMLVRAIVDHVPPIFSQQAFAQVANNYAGSTSFKGSMQHLDQSFRKVADAHLHTQIRTKETTPTPPQVDFRADLDVLLGEIVRILK